MEFDVSGWGTQRSGILSGRLPSIQARWSYFTGTGNVCCATCVFPRHPLGSSCTLWTLCQDPHRAQVSLWLCWSTSGTCKLIFSKGWHFSRCFWTGSLLGLRQSFHIYQGGGDLCAGPGSLSLCGIVPCAPSTLDDERLVLELRLEHPGV